jgi:hypothetical protein
MFGTVKLGLIDLQSAPPPNNHYSQQWAVTPNPENSNFKKARQTAVGKDYKLV